MHRKRNVMLIHGAWSTSQSFNHISRMIDMYLESYVRYTILFDYNPFVDNMDKIVDKARKKLDDEAETLVIGHSLGGLIALAISDHEKCYRTITLASPLSGIKINRLFQPFIYARAPVLGEIAPCSSFIRNIQKKQYDKRIDCMITTRGYNPLIFEKSDGVITVATQEKWMPQSAVATYEECNHYEILQSDQAFSIIKKALTNQ